MSIALPGSALESRVGLPQPYEAPPHGSLRSWETWLSLGLVFVAFLAISTSIEQADWVPEMPSLTSAAMLGLTVAFVLAHLRWPSVVLLLLSIPLGLASTLYQTMNAMRLSDPTLGTDLAARWDELTIRLDDWFTALLAGDVSTDPMPFILVVVLLSWSMAFAAVWSVFRLRNGWLAVIPGGVALLTNISYLPGQPSIAFVVYLFAGILLVTRMHAVRADAGWRRERTIRPPLLSLEVLNFATWAGLVLIVIAWTVPTANHWGPVADYWQELTAPLSTRIERVGRVFFGIDAKRGDLIHKFGDVLPLQGRVRLSGDPLATVEAPSDVVYLRAAGYDQYTGRAWRQTAAEPLPLAPTNIDAASFGTPQTRALFRKPFVATVDLKTDLLNRRLLVPGEALASDREATLLVGPDSADVLGLEPAGRVRATDRYEVVGTLSGATAATLARAPDTYPQWVVDRYLQLPESLPIGVRELANSLTKDVTSPYLRARRIEQHLRTQYLFDLNTPDPPPRADAVGWFLLEQKRGYFDQYASAMVVMLRASGVPARLAVGFALDPRGQDPTTKAYTLSDREAWAWPEVYIGGLGWVEFNPTPTRPAVQRSQDDSEFVGAQAELAESDAESELSLLSDLEVDPTGGEAFQPGGGRDESGLLSTFASVFATLATLGIGLALVAVLGAVIVRVLWDFRFRALSAPVARFAKLQELAGWAGVAPLTTRTPLEAARELRVTAGLDVSLDELARAYNRERYGRPPEAGQASERGGTMDERAEALERQNESVYLAARNRLVRLALRRLLPRRGERQALPSAIAIRR